MRVIFKSGVFFYVALYAFAGFAQYKGHYCVRSAYRQAVMRCASASNPLDCEFQIYKKLTTYTQGTWYELANCRGVGPQYNWTNHWVRFGSSFSCCESIVYYTFWSINTAENIFSVREPIVLIQCTHFCSLWIWNFVRYDCYIRRL